MYLAPPSRELGSTSRFSREPGVEAGREHVLDENSEWVERARFDPELGEDVTSSFGVQVAIASEFVLITDAHAPNSAGTGWLHVAACE